MSDGSAFVAIVAALFAMESFAVVADGGAVFVSGWLRRYAVRLTRDLLQVAKGRLLIFHPLVASSHHYVAGLPALALDGDGVADCGPEDFDTRTRRAFIPWERLGRVTCDERRIRADGLGVLDCGAVQAARLWARVLNEIRSAPRARRAELARRWMRLRCSTAIVQRRIERVNAACSWLEALTDNFLLLLVVWCAAYSWLGQTRLVLGLLIGGELAGWTTAFLFWRAHARFYPRARRERLGKAFVMALCFPVALRARAVLAREAVAFAHPAAVATVLLAKPRAVEFVRSLALRWMHPLPVGGARPDARLDAATTSPGTALDAIKTLSKELDLKWTTLLEPPNESDATLKTLCPRCHAAYVLASGSCADCPGIALVPIAKATEKS